MTPMGRQTLTPEMVVEGYLRGFFPMAESREGEIGWFSPDPRAVFPLDGLVVSRSLRRTIRRGTFEVRVDTAFRHVVQKCAERAETWISDEILDVYSRLHDQGIAHSVESWAGDELAGGLYGVALGGAFFGESMFSAKTDASKVALVALVERLRRGGYLLLDTQFITPHLRRLGAVEIPRAAYLRALRRALLVKGEWTAGT